MKNSVLTISLFLSLVFLMGCGGEEPTPDITPTAQPTPTLAPTPALPTEGSATVDSIELMIMESFPVQVSVRARGDLPDGCTEIDEIETTQNGTAFEVTITTLRAADAVCTEALVPFDETIELDVLNLPAGTYTVDVNGRSGTFNLAADNTMLEEPTATTSSANDGIINGTIWHDLCAVAVDEDGETAVTSAGCVASADETTFQADGTLELSEPGIANITVSLGEGECPAVGLATTETDDAGDYVFTDLAAGTYCVSVDALAAINEALLPGQWTFPESGIAETAVTIEAGEIVSDINFGWDFEFLPVPDVDLATCTNSIEFITDLNIPDDSVFTPQSEFVKSWRLRNDGTCPWTTEYNLVQVSGDTVTELTEVPLSRIVAPGETVDLSINVIAPEALGTYRSNWQISNADGVPFGIGGVNTETFWVQFDVGLAEATPPPNSSVIGGVIWEDFCQVTDDGPSAGCVQLEGTNVFRADGTLNFGESRFPGVTVILSNGACPADSQFNSADIVDTAVTDQSGLYRFENLDEGLYCVGIDAFSPANVDLLIPGTWTWPALGTGLLGINLGAGEERLEVDFGWQHLD